MSDATAVLENELKIFGKGWKGRYEAQEGKTLIKTLCLRNTLKISPLWTPHDLKIMFCVQLTTGGQNSGSKKELNRCRDEERCKMVTWSGYWKKTSSRQASCVPRLPDKTVTDEESFGLIHRPFSCYSLSLPTTARPASPSPPSAALCFACGIQFITAHYHALQSHHHLFKFFGCLVYDHIIYSLFYTIVMLVYKTLT